MNTENHAISINWIRKSFNFTTTLRIYNIRAWKKTHKGEIDFPLFSSFHCWKMKIIFNVIKFMESIFFCCFFVTTKKSEFGDWKVKSTWWWLNLLRWNILIHARNRAFLLVFWKYTHAFISFLYKLENHIYNIRFNPVPAARDLKKREEIFRGNFVELIVSLFSKIYGLLELWCQSLLIISWKLCGSS